MVRLHDEGNPYYVATTYTRKFIFGPKEPNGVILLNAVTGEEINNIDEAVTGEKTKQKEKVNGIITSIKTQVVNGTTVYYLKINDKIYKIEANKNTLDKLPFLEVNQTISAETDENNFLSNITFE